YANGLAQRVETPSVLMGVIDQLGLYPRERASGMSTGEVVELMKKSVEVGPGGSVGQVVVRFGYPDEHAAQQVTNHLMGLFVSEFMHVSIETGRTLKPVQL